MDQERVKYLFSYRNDGNLIWKNLSSNNSRIELGQIAGTKTNESYINIMINRKSYRLHRLIWIYHNGDIPDNMVIDHINGDVEDNRIENLQILTHTQNLHKQKLSKNNKSGFKGVSFNKRRNQWVARIACNNKKIYIGEFSDIKDAAIAYDNAAKELHGEYAILNFPE